MSLKNKALVGAAALALAGGTAMLAMPHANAATDRCGRACLTLASQKYGTADVVAVGAGPAGDLAAFWYRSSEDFDGQPEGTVYDFYKAGIIPQSEEKTYGSDEVYQYEYAPYGILSGQCLSATAGSTAVSLSTCGEDTGTLWVGLSGWLSGNYQPMMSAALSSNSAMLLTASSATGALSVTQMNLTTTTSNGVTTASVSPYQKWEFVEGAYNSSVTSDRLG